jgi:hypothetical protein
MAGLANILWFVVAVVIILWLLGLLLKIGEGFIHILLVIAAIIIVYNLLTGRKTV